MNVDRAFFQNSNQNYSRLKQHQRGVYSRLKPEEPSLIPDTWLNADLLHFIICLQKTPELICNWQECLILTLFIQSGTEITFDKSSCLQCLPSALTGCVNGTMCACGEERILGISLAFSSTLPFSSPNSPYSSVRTICCSYYCNGPKELGDQLGIPLHTKPQKIYNDMIMI